MPSLPSDDTSLYHWILYLTVGYLVIAYGLGWKRDRQLFASRDYQKMLTRIFDAATFSGSFMLLLGILNDGVLRAIGSTKPFLLVAGIAGFLYGLHSLFTADK